MHRFRSYDVQFQWLVESMHGGCVYLLSMILYHPVITSVVSFY